MQTSRTVHFVLIAWCLIGGALRVVWFLVRGLPVDALPVITLLLGGVALVLALRAAPHPTRSPSG